MNDRLRPTRALRGGEAAALLEDRLARRIVAYLDESAATPPPGVAERLRFARSQALDRARAAQPAAVAAASASLPAPAVARGAALAGSAGGRAPREPSTWWVRLAAALPLAALLGGLALIQHQHVNDQIAAAAEIDADLLTDAVPPSAYNDPGFLEFLKAPQN